MAIKSKPKPSRQVTVDIGEWGSWAVRGLIVILLGIASLVGTDLYNSSKQTATAVATLTQALTDLRGSVDDMKGEVAKLWGRPKK